MLFGGTALYLASFGFVRFAMFHQRAGTRLVAAAAALMAWPLAPHMPAVAVLLVLAVILGALNLGELLTIKAGRALW